MIVIIRIVVIAVEEIKMIGKVECKELWRLNGYQWCGKEEGIVSPIFGAYIPFVKIEK